MHIAQFSDEHLVKQHSVHLEGKQVCRDQATFQSKTNQDQVHLIKESVHYHFIAITYCSDLEVHLQNISLIQMCICKVGFYPNSLLS
jgi:hypothetical protein